MAKTKEDTPLLKQYFSVKAQNPDAVLLFRVGDFYESYSDDALITSKVLGIVLTRKSNGEKGDTPMAGIPHHALAQYLPKLVRAGYKVAICDQLEDPKLAQAKLVKRGVTEILTPGIAFGEGMLEQKEHNWLCGLAFDNAEVGAAFLDASTGTFRVAPGIVALKENAPLVVRVAVTSLSTSESALSPYQSVTSVVSPAPKTSSVPLNVTVCR